MAIDFVPLIDFDLRAKQGFARISGGKSLSFYVAEHKAGRCALFAVLDGDVRAGSMLLCSETKPSGERILAVMAASIEGNVNRILKGGLGFVNDYARKTRHHTVKFYTSSDRLAGAFLKNGARAKITWNPYNG